MDGTDWMSLSARLMRTLRAPALAVALALTGAGMASAAGKRLTGINLPGE